MIGQGGFEDAFALDVSSKQEFLRAFQGRGAAKRPSRASTTKEVKATKRPSLSKRRPLRERDDEDVEMLFEKRSAKQTRLHNTLTNALLAIAQKRKLDVEQGSTRACMFDALVRAYAGTERDLLIEVKPTCDRATCRLAAGQLQDYRRLLPNRAATDLAVLFPSKPSKHAFDLFGDLGIRVAWFYVNQKKIVGEIRF